MILRVLIISLFLAVLVAVGFMLPNQESPKATAETFLSKLRSGDNQEIVDMFGDNTCKCPPKGGYGTYINYGEQPTLAFLVGKQFDFTITGVEWLENNISYVMPWDRPETTYVDVTLNFPEGQYRPLLLPLQMAFGMSMTESQFADFLKNPAKDAWKGFTQRLRPQVTAGLIPKPQITRQPIQRDEQLENLTSPEMMPFLTPTDAADIVTKNGGNVDKELIEKHLPRLISAKLKLKVVKSGQLKGWMINRFRIEDATILSDGQQLPVRFPKYDK